jgi:predicted Zn-dependent protease
VGLESSARMPLDQAQTAELSYDPSGAFRIDLVGASRPLTVAFTGLWCVGWLLVIASGISEIARLGRIELGLGTWLSLWIGAGAPLLIALLWTAGGRRETLFIREGSLRLVRPIGPFRPVVTFDAHEIRGLRATPARHPLVADFHAIKGFWIGGSGPIVFRSGRRAYACGSALDSTAAVKLVADLAAFMPQAMLDDITVPAPPSALAPWGVAYLAMGMLVPAVTMPFKLAIADRAICFCEDPAPPPENPVDVASLEGSGRLLFVPVDGYSSERARQIAEHFRQQFGVRIRVEPELTTGADAYDARRDQMNAGALLTALETKYPEGSPRTVVVGLTDADMYIPESNWRYAFSYRRANRLAIVSSARMDRGCLGLLPASDERQLARMRKMVGKNIGVMYYRLPLNRDPRSLLYAYVGGPQELDTMSEVF